MTVLFVFFSRHWQNLPINLHFCALLIPPSSILTYKNYFEYHDKSSKKKKYEKKIRFRA